MELSVILKSTLKIKLKFYLNLFLKIKNKKYIQIRVLLKLT